MDIITKNLKEECIRRIDESSLKINACLDKLTPEQLWYRPNSASNAVGNLILHLSGNLTQYIISTLHDKPDQRERSKEFSSTIIISNNELASKFKTVISQVTNIINILTTTQLEKSYEVQCYKETGVGILVHVTEHLSYHTGQIVYITKMITAENMKFYDDAALEKTHPT